MDVGVAEQGVEQARLVRQVVGEQRALVDLRVVHGARRDVDPLRRARHALREPADHAVERRREEQRLARRGGAGDDRLDVLDEPHVEHAVGFVEHEDFDAREVDAAAVEMVLQAAGRGDHDVHRLAELLQLQSVGHAADETRGAQALAVAVGVRGLVHLQRELARRRQHEDAGAGAAPGGRDRASRCRAGSRKAAVLPLPVCDETSRSVPASAAGMAADGGAG